MLTQRTGREAPLFSVCIPQFNRTSFLLELLRSIDSQTCRDVEVCISDGGSTDGRRLDILECLEQSELIRILYSYYRDKLGRPERSERLGVCGPYRPCYALAVRRQFECCMGVHLWPPPRSTTRHPSQRPTRLEPRPRSTARR